MNRFYTIAHRYDNIKVIELHFFALVFSCHGTMLSGLSEFPTNHFFIQFSFLEYIQYVLIDSRAPFIEKLCYLFHI